LIDHGLGNIWRLTRRPDKILTETPGPQPLQIYR
jgi:hypothetical protein